MRPHLLEEIQADSTLELRLGRAAPEFRTLMEAALAGRELSVEDGVRCLTAEDDDLVALVAVADAIRQADVGNDVTYIVNRNINFTNVCFIGCKFCAFKRQRWEAGAFDASIEAVLAKVQEAVDRSATEICLQGGINPEMPPFTYRDILTAIKQAFPATHVHAFSPMEILYGSRRTGLSYGDYLAMLRNRGLGSIPGTAAEILDDNVRKILSHKKLSVSAWVDIVKTAHSIGIPSSSTVMYGHIETPRHIAEHVALLRRIQRDTGGFTEFVPLRFIHQNTELFRHVMSAEPPSRGVYDLRVYAFSRLMLRGVIDNVQTSWVKLGYTLAQLSLNAGANDFGGTLMEESISREAGADAGEFTTVEEIRRLVDEIGRRPVERTTLYERRDARSENEAHTDPTTDNGAGGRNRGREVSARPDSRC